jgi:ELWxxDGT repeat protein
MKYLVLLLLFTGANIAFSQVEIVKNLDSDTDPQVPFLNPGSTPTSLTKAGSSLYFVANDGLYGRELWKSNGSEGGTVRVKNINPSGNATISGLFDFNGILVFQADDGVNGNELWKSDGTAAGTYMIKNMTAGKDGSYMQNLIINKTDLLFYGENGDSYGLWKSDGTDNGTVLLKTVDIASDPMITINNITYFIGYRESYKELWRSDGTTDGTYMIKELQTYNNNKSYLANLNGTLFFTSLNSNYDNEIWKSDGTTNGTLVVKTLPYTYAAISEFTSFNGLLFFSGDDRELWKSDGTSAGTQMVKKINTNGGISSVKNFTISNGSLFFTAVETTSLELFKTDGTTGGTVKVTPMTPSKLISCNDQLFFTSNSTEQGIELYKTDGTEGGTQLVKDINPNGNSNPNYLTIFNNALFFSAAEGNNGIELWKSDGTAVGTSMVKNINNKLVPAVANGLYHNNIFFFVKNTPSTGRELWRSDGTESGTIILKDIYPGSTGSFPGNLKVFNNEVYFTASHPEYGTEIWKTNGTLSGTVPLKDIYPGEVSSYPSNLTIFNNVLVFSAGDDINGQELWKTDGTTNGTVILKDIFPGPSGSGIQNITAANDLLFFSAADNTTGTELWKSDGTSAGTIRIKDINTAVEIITSGGGYSGGGTTTTVPGSSSPGELITVGNVLFFSAIDSNNGIELWRSDGTQSGTYMVRDILPGAMSSWPRRFVISGGSFFFTANNDLWKSDGTASGTVLIKSIGYGYDNANYINNKLYFSGYSTETGVELWTSDGTTAGTNILLDAGPGAESSNPEKYFWFNGSIYFFTTQQNFHKKLWKSNGTTAGTVLVAEFISTVADYKIVNNELFIVGISNGGNGLFKLDKQSEQLQPVYSSSSSEQNPYALTTFNEKALYFLHNENLLRIRAEFEINIANVGPLEVNEQVNLATATPDVSTIDFIVEDGPGTLQGKTLQATGQGTIIVKATYPGTNTFKPAEKIFTIEVVDTSDKIDQVILMSEVNNKTFGDNPFIVTATGGGSNNPVVFTVVSGPATATNSNGSTIIITGAGHIILKASQAGNENYKSAPDVIREFNGSKASQNINFNNPGDKVYGANPFELLAAGGQSGNPVVFEILEGAATVTNSTISITGTGTIKIKATQAGNENYLDATETVRQFNVVEATALITFSGKNVIYDGAPKQITVSTIPANLPVEIKYNGSIVKPVNAGIYNVVASITGSNYQGTASETLTIKKAQAEINFSNKSRTYNGSPFAITTTTQPLNLPLTIKYNGSSNAPASVGIYTCVAEITDANYEGTASETLIINKAQAKISLSGETTTYNGSSKSISVTTEPLNLPTTIKYNGSTTAPINAGIYTSTVEVTDANYEGTISGTLTIKKAQAEAILADETVVFNGKPKTVTAVTKPTNLPVVITYNGLSVVPVNAGVYKVKATMQHANYEINESTSTLNIIKAPALISSSNTKAIYDGKVKTILVNTTPANLKTNLIYEPGISAVDAGTYKVVAIIDDVNYQGSVDETLVIIKSAQTIDFAKVLEKSNLSAPFSVNAISSSGLPLTLSIKSGPATINGNVITLTKETGTIDVEAFQSGNNNYSEARANITINVKLDLVLRIEDSSTEIFQVWPMPANKDVRIKTDGQEIRKVILMNAIGETLAEMESLNSEAVMDLTSYPSGNYFLMIITEDRSLVKKIMIVR